MTAQDDPGDFEQLHALVATEDIKGFLDGMTGLAAAMMTGTTGERVETAVSLRRRKHSTTIAGSSDDAIMHDGFEQRLGNGPATEALRTGKPVLLADVSTEFRWRRYCEDLAESGCSSLLCIPCSWARTHPGP
jgi:hypothetical protein